MVYKISFDEHLNELKKSDSEVYNLVLDEIKRQEETIELIPSENAVSPAVMETQGSVFTNKYSEGYPGKRYYGGNEVVDKVEQLAIDRAKEIFGADHVNVQAHSGSGANMAAYMAVLEPGDKVLAINLDQGGHLTHGHHLNFSGKLYNFVQYELNKESSLIDYDLLRIVALKEKPKLIVTGFSAYPRDVDFKKFKEIADECSAMLLADISHIAGSIAAGLHQNPVPFCDIVTTTTHKTLRGPRGAIILCKEKYAKDVDRQIFPGIQGGPLEHVIAAKAVAFGEVLKPEFKEYQKKLLENNKSLAQGLLDNGIKLVSGGTENHLMLIDLTPFDLRGKEVELKLDEVNICTNKNMIPFDLATAFNPSGIRIGSPVITSRGFSREDSYRVGEFIAKVIKNISDEKIMFEVKREVLELCKKYPLYEK
ncbi:MAG: serine hydroxymethyltransferase [Candidatus Woesearchaeota archaeon]|jgi:glycine hydroxymethyltransferase|nr:serine hydroxymethyltransferase [Candidatus Woesearchaeota archaeon]